VIVLRAVKGADVFAVFLDVGDHKNFRLLGMTILAQHMQLQRAEFLTEIDLLLRRHGLALEDQHRALAELFAQGGEGCVINRLREVDIFHLAANERLEPLEFYIGIRRDGCVGHGDHS
jgi:hypothetical protein